MEATNPTIMDDTGQPTGTVLPFKLDLSKMLSHPFVWGAIAGVVALLVIQYQIRNKRRPIRTINPE